MDHQRTRIAKIGDRAEQFQMIDRLGHHAARHSAIASHVFRQAVHDPRRTHIDRFAQIDEASVRSTISGTPNSSATFATAGISVT